MSSFAELLAVKQNLISINSLQPAGKDDSWIMFEPNYTSGIVAFFKPELLDDPVLLMQALAETDDDPVLVDIVYESLLLEHENCYTYSVDPECYSYIFKDNLVLQVDLFDNVLQTINLEDHEATTEAD